LRAGLVLGLGLIAVLAPAVVLAASFLDVPPTSSFYNAIERLYAARITTGCGGGNYCPKANVTREQMAAFLGRAGGVAEQASGGGALTLTGGSIVGEVTIKAGDITGGTAYVQLIGTFGIFSDDTEAASYPYKAVFVLADKSGPFVGYEHYLQVEGLAEDEFGDATGAVQVLVEVPTGVSKTFQLIAGQLTGAEGLLVGYGTIDALYFPFSQGGGWIDPTPERAGDAGRSLDWLRN
jgi:hypothetical protein